MYFPYFRGKQNELIVIRDNASMIKDAGIIPIIEPVKENLLPLNRAISELTKVDGKFILIVNPKYGDLKNNPKPLFDELIENEPDINKDLILGYIVDHRSNLLDIEDFLKEHEEYEIAIIHYGFPKSKDLATSLTKFPNVKMHIFIDGHSGKLYQRHFDSSEKILIRDGFQLRRNIEHPDNEHFSDLHETYELEGMTGFGDFLIVGDDYMETGGPAYTVAIHLTYLDDEENMYIWHFLSDSNDSPVDPAGKFLEALGKLIVRIDEDTSAFNSTACDEFRELYKRKHYPGLGYIKKLSMQHHLELMSNHLKDVAE
jgi:hypothetical protein